MKTRISLAAVLLACATCANAAPAVPAAAPSDAAVKAAKYAVTAYRVDVVDTLAKLVSFNTVADKDLPFERNPRHAGFKNYLKQESARLGLDFADHGQVLVIGLGPLDRSSEPGKLLARGAEDDKGPIATALYAMKSLKDLQLPLSRRIELYVYMAEESDRDALEQFVKTHTLPQVNITLDADSRLFPRALSFGPAMPHSVYTGHSEHEFITLKQLLLNLEMYTAVLVELAR